MNTSLSKSRLKSHYQYGSGLYNCRVCGLATRETGECESSCQLCQSCYTIAGYDNQISDNESSADEGCLSILTQCFEKIRRKGGNVKNVLDSNTYAFPNGDPALNPITHSMENQMKTTEDQKAARRAAYATSKKLLSDSVLRQAHSHSINAGKMLAAKNSVEQAPETEKKETMKNESPAVEAPPVVEASAPATATEASATPVKKAFNRKLTSEEMAELVAGVKEYAKKHYNRSGWDYVIETMSDEDIVKLVDRATSIGGAIINVRVHVKTLDDHRKEIQAA